MESSVTIGGILRRSETATVQVSSERRLGSNLSRAMASSAGIVGVVVVPYRLGGTVPDKMYWHELSTNSERV